ncbi:TPR-like protein [Rhizoctonia solani]|uniref:TPR-like protein n=1 Tax=Rhizoctonia solani TaxID=456999 RepID=A0A8H7IEN1_9AGAM|nr:TPR-like protein [Rhizoctonia solani]
MGHRATYLTVLAWAKLTSKHAYLKIIEAFRAAIEALPHFIWLGSTTAQRYEDILSAENLAVRAASAAILSSEYSLALEWLEHARCVVWNQSLMLRSPVDVLQSSHPGLATQIKSISQQLHYANSESPTTQSSIFHSAIDTAEHRHRLAREYTDLLVQARKLPGFGNFLMPPSSIDLAQAARNGPVVVINCEENNCDALLIIPGRANVTHIPLSNFTGTKAQRIRLEMENSSRSRRSSERGAERRPIQEEELGFENILSDLWYDIVNPVLDFLGYTKNTDETAKNVPHITWCPTGAVSFLPLHAAGDYNHRDHEYSTIISSYTPTLTALLGSSLGTLNAIREYSLLAKKLHQAIKVARVKHSELLGSQATTVAVLDAMEQHDWVHLACHAHQNVQNPTESGFFLHNGTLT